jgi:hypothetical protein
MDAVYNHTAEGSWMQDGRLVDKCHNLCDDITEAYRGTPQEPSVSPNACCVSR